MSEKETWFERNVHWLYFIAGIAVAQAEITFIQDFVNMWGEWRFTGFIVVGLGFIFATKSISYLIDKIINFVRSRKK